MLHTTELTQETLDAIQNDEELTVRIWKRTGFALVTIKRWQSTGFQRKLAMPQVLEEIAKHLSEKNGRHISISDLVKKPQPNTAAA